MQRHIHALHGHARHVAGIGSSNTETAEVAPVELDPEFGPNASRRSSEESGGRAARKGRRPRSSSSGGCRLSSHLFGKSDEANVARVAE
jgi:hypothetical protein